MLRLPLLLMQVLSGAGKQWAAQPPEWAPIVPPTIVAPPAPPAQHAAPPAPKLPDDIGARVSAMQKSGTHPHVAWPPGLGHHGDIGPIAPAHHNSPPARNQPHTSTFNSAHAADAWIANREARRVAKQTGHKVATTPIRHPGDLAKQLQDVHKIVGHRMSNMGSYMAKSMHEISQMGVRAQTGHMPPHRRSPVDITDHAKEVQKIMSSMQSAGAASKSTNDFVSHKISEDKKELDALQARAHGIDLKKVKAATKPPKVGNVQEVEKIMGAPISAYDKYKSHSNKNYLKELSSIRQDAFTDSMPHDGQHHSTRTRPSVRASVRDAGHHQRYKQARKARMKTMAKDLVVAEKSMAKNP